MFPFTLPFELVPVLIVVLFGLIMCTVVDNPTAHFPEGNDKIYIQSFNKNIEGWDW